MATVWQKLSQVAELAGLPVLEVKLGTSPYSEINWWLIGLGSAGGTLLLVSVVLCLKYRCWRKLSRREVSFEMYGQFRDESSATAPS